MQNRLKRYIIKLSFLTMTFGLTEGHADSRSSPFKTLLINSGTYELTNSVNDDVTVDGATFTGTGSINGDLLITNGAILSAGVNPDNKLGVIHVLGDYTQSNDSTFRIDVSNDGNNDLVVVQDNANLAGNLEIVLPDSPITSNQSHLIMRVEGDIGGTFDTITTGDDATLAILSFVDKSEGKDVILNLSNSFLSIARTTNQNGIAGLFANDVNPATFEAQALRNEVLALAQSPDTADRALQVYDQMSGYQYAGVLSFADLAVNQFIRRLYDPLRSIVTTHRPCSTNCWDPNYFDPYSNLPVMLDAPCNLCNPIPPTLDFWFDIGGGRTHFSGNCNARGFHLNDFHITGGVQTTFLSDWTLGCALSYVRQNFKHKHDGSAGVNNALLGIYGLYKTCGWYALADVVLGYNQGSFKRRVETDENSYRSRSSPKTYEAVFYIEAGLDYPWRNFLVQPFIGFETGTYSRNGIHENGGAIAIDVFESNSSTSSSRLGFHFTTTPKILCNWSLSFDLAWQYRFNTVSNSIHGYSPSYNDDFHSKGIDTGRNAIDFAGTLTTELFENCELYGEFMLLGSSNLFSYDFLAGIKYRW